MFGRCKFSVSSASASRQSCTKVRQMGIGHYADDEDPSRVLRPIFRPGGMALRQIRSRRITVLSRSCTSRSEQHRRRYTMKARLFTLAITLAPLAVLVGAIRPGR